jgi:cbb3-type cytochrome oxidase cytochrome c subunit
VSSNTGAAEKPEPGLAVTFTALDGNKATATDVTVSPNVWLYVPAGKPATPFLSGERFSADWTGFVSSEIRENYTFQAELSGELKLEINAIVVLEASAKGTNTAPSKPVRLNKGTNAFKVHFTSPTEGDASIRLFWSTKEFLPEPIALSALTHETSPELQQANRLRLGRELFIELRCAGCHSGPPRGAGIPELMIDAPTFEGIGSRRKYEWMAGWIADPRALRPTAHMPKMFHGQQARDDAEAAAAFLASLKSDSASGDAKEPGRDQAEPGKKRFETLHCTACHNTPGTAENDAQKISFNTVGEKFASGALVAFLRKPGEHYAWIRMPDFRLAAEEAAQLAAFLEAAADKPKVTRAPTDAATIERGRKRVQTAGCLNCHSLRIENQFKTVALADLTPEKWKRGCLAGKPADDSKAPRFNLDSPALEALQAFAATDRASLTRHVPVEFAERQARLLGCAECHGKFEGFPSFESLGDKLKPEWMKAFIAGEVSYKPRPWIEARMPAFAPPAEALAVGLAAGHGFPPQTPAEPPIDQEAVPIGRKLVSANGGFFCVSCHGVGSTAAMQVFESNGVNLAYTGARLQKSFYHRWVRNPQRIDPPTKMPVYFDSEGKSPLTDYYGGDAEKQIEAIWQYIRLGDKMPAPPAAR